MKRCPPLTEAQSEELQLFVKAKDHNSREVTRAQAVLMLDKKLPIETIKSLTGLGRRQIFAWRTVYREQGLKDLEDKRKGHPKQLLTKSQLLEIDQIIREQKPTDLGYRSEFWTTGALADVIERKYKVIYKSKTSYCLLFKSSKFTYHKPGKVYEKRDEVKVIAWQQEIALIIKAAMENSETVILAEDEMILSSQTTFQRIWLPEGQYPKIEVSNTRANAIIFGFLNLKTGQEHAFTSDKLNMYVTKKMLQKIRKIYSGKKIILLWDQPGWHRGSEVTAFIEKDTKIKVIYFPAYSPEENPQEHVWKEGRAKVTNNKFIRNLARTAREFVAYLNKTKFNYSFYSFSAVS